MPAQFRALAFSCKGVPPAGYSRLPLLWTARGTAPAICCSSYIGSPSRIPTFPATYLPAVRLPALRGLGPTEPGVFGVDRRDRRDLIFILPMNNEYSGGLYHKENPQIERDETDWTSFVPSLGQNWRVSLNQVVHLRLTAAELRMLDIVRGNKSRSEYIRESIERSTAVGGNAVATKFSDIPRGGTRRAAFKDAVQRMGDGDVDGAAEVYRDFVQRDDRFTADCRDWLRSYFHSPNAPAEVPGVFRRAHSLMDAMRVVEGETAQRAYTGDARNLKDDRFLHNVLRGGSGDRAVGGWNGYNGFGKLDSKLLEYEKRSVQGTSDFPALVMDVFMESVLLAIPEATGAAHRISAEILRTDLREFGVVVAQGADELTEQTFQEQEYTSGVFHFGRVEAMLRQWRKVYTFSEELLLDDSSGTLRNAPRLIAGEIGRKTADVVFDALTTSSEFKTANNNIASSGAKLNAGTLGAAWAAIATQEAPGGGPAGYRPAWVLVPEAARISAGKIVKDASPRDDEIVEVLSDPRVTGTEWYAGCNPAAWPGIVRVIPENRDMPRIRMHSHFDSDGIAFSVAHDVGAAVTIPRSLWKNEGA